MKRIIIATCLILALAPGTSSADAFSGTLKFLRVNEVGDSFGPPGDAISAEVIVSFDNVSFYGFQLRADTNQATHQAMADLLRDAFANSWSVTLEASIAPGKHQGMLFRVYVSKP